MSVVDLAVGVLGITVLVLAWALVRLQARHEALRKLVSEEWNELLAAQQALQQLGAQRLGERLEVVEDRLDAVAEEQQQMLMRDQAITAYSEAIREARQGASAEQLMASHQLGRAEAELIVRLHASNAAPS
ncbi:MAG: DUF2802 domain-containing protein [Pseudomonadales bacterium]